VEIALHPLIGLMRASIRFQVERVAPDALVVGVGPRSASLNALGTTRATAAGQQPPERDQCPALQFLGSCAEAAATAAHATRADSLKRGVRSARSSGRTIKNTVISGKIARSRQ